MYVQRMTKGNLEVKKAEPKSNQLAPHVASMATAPAASKPTVVVEKNNRGFISHLKERSEFLNRKGSDTIRMFA